MNLTQAQLDWLDEQPARRRGGRIFSFKEGGAGTRTRYRVPGWAIRAAVRRSQLELMAFEFAWTAKGRA